MRKIERVKLFPNNNSKSLDLAEILKGKFNEKNIEVVDEDFDLAVAIGGDGSFLRMIKNCSFKEDIYYIGINTGTLGFAQEIYPDNIDELIEKLKKDDYKIETIGVLDVCVTTEKQLYKFNALNEIAIRDGSLNTVYLDIIIDDNLLEHFVGDGILVSTSFGSSAYNLSFGGSLVYNELHTMQITPIAPLNSKSYRSLINSVIIPENRKIEIIPNCNSRYLVVSKDGENTNYNDVVKLEVAVKRKINCLHMKEYDYTKKINEKFL